MSASTTTGPGQAGADDMCESCRQAPVSLLLHLPGAAPFAICGGGAPTVVTVLHHPRGPATNHHGADDPAEHRAPAECTPMSRSPEREPVVPEGAPPLDWSGELVIEQSWREVAWPIAATAIPVLVALVAYVVTGSLLA